MTKKTHLKRCFNKVEMAEKNPTTFISSRLFVDEKSFVKALTMDEPETKADTLLLTNYSS